MFINIIITINIKNLFFTCSENNINKCMRKPYMWQMRSADTLLRKSKLGSRYSQIVAWTKVYYVIILRTNNTTFYTWKPCSLWLSLLLLGSSRYSQIMASTKQCYVRFSVFLDCYIPGRTTLCVHLNEKYYVLESQDFLLSPARSPTLFSRNP